MGTDIHGVFEAKIDGQWKAVPSNYDFDRDYLLFAYLANVRNGFGFAGIPTHIPVPPISEPRGFPEDWKHSDEYPLENDIASEWEKKNPEDGQRVIRWMGDHSFSWLTADEILNHTYVKITRIGVITIEQFKTWKGSEPEGGWSDAVWGKGLKTSLPDEIESDTTHVQIRWNSASKPNYFIDEVQRLKNTYGEVRFVFGFDS